MLLLVTIYSSWFFSNIRKISKNEAATAVVANMTPIFLFDSAIYLLMSYTDKVYTKFLRLYSMSFPKGIEDRLADCSNNRYIFVEPSSCFD